MRGTLLDGDWGHWAGTILQPSFGLRRRFDQLLSAQGEVSLTDLRTWVALQVTALHGSAGANQVLDVWDRYLQVQSAHYGTEADPHDPTTWQTALAEHSRVRRQILGSAWAEAFFGAEERDLAADAARRVAASATPTATSTPDLASALLVPPAGRSTSPAEAARLYADRVTQFGAAGADRLQANDAAWLAWEQRLATTRADWSAVARDPALSPVQRQQAQERLLEERFAADEVARARALLALPSPGG